MPTSDFLPSQDANLIPWTENFIAVANVNLAMISQGASEVSVMFVVKTEEKEKALQALYAAFFN